MHAYVVRAVNSPPFPEGRKGGLQRPSVMAAASLLGNAQKKEPAERFRILRARSKLDLLGYLTLIKMMAKVYSAIDSISTRARMSMF